MTDLSKANISPSVKSISEILLNTGKQFTPRDNLPKPNAKSDEFTRRVQNWIQMGETNRLPERSVSNYPDTNNKRNQELKFGLKIPNKEKENIKSLFSKQLKGSDDEVINISVNAPIYINLTTDDDEIMAEDVGNVKEYKNVKKELLDIVKKPIRLDELTPALRKKQFPHWKWQNTNGKAMNKLTDRETTEDSRGSKIQDLIRLRSQDCNVNSKSGQHATKLIIIPAEKSQKQVMSGWGNQSQPKMMQKKPNASEKMERECGNDEAENKKAFWQIQSPRNEGFRYCLRCGTEVYFAERRLAADGQFHSSCFTCVTCGVTLDSVTCYIRERQVYCKYCFNLNNRLPTTYV